MRPWRMKKYDSYKDSGVEWIGEVPGHWDVYRLKWLFHNLDNLREPISAEKRERNNPQYDYYGASGIIDKIDYYNVDDKVLLIGEDGANLVFRNLPLIYKAEGKFWVNNHSHILKNKKGIDYEYMFYTLESADYSNFITGSAQPKLSQSNLEQQELPVPPLSEQQSIATYLDKKCFQIDKVISTQQKRIALLQELKQSVITHAVTKGLNPNVEMKDSCVEWIGEVPKHWEVIKIKQICKNEKYAIKTGPFGTQLKGQELQPDGDVVVYNQRNVIDNNFNNSRFYVTKEKAKSLSSFYTNPQDVLVTSRGTIGRAAILDGKYPMGILHPCLIAIRVNENICSQKWLVTYINETDCFKTDITLSSNATTIDVIYTDTIKNIVLPVPPLSEQQNISTYLDKKCASIDASISKAQHQVDLLQEYKQSLITEVVTGKRKVY